MVIRNEIAMVGKPTNSKDNDYDQEHFHNLKDKFIFSVIIFYRGNIQQNFEYANLTNSL